MNYDQKYFLFLYFLLREKGIEMYQWYFAPKKEEIMADQQTDQTTNEHEGLRAHWEVRLPTILQILLTSCRESGRIEGFIESSAHIDLAAADPLLLKLAARATLNLTSTFATLTISNGEELAVEIQGDLEKLTNAAASDSDATQKMKSPAELNVTACARKSQVFA